jgi:DNA-binding XRE family transcriptional regulator
MIKSNLRNKRELQGETTVSMARRLGIGASRYYMIENGQRPATPEIANRIAAIFCVPVEEIFLPQSFTVRDAEVDPQSA